MNTEIIAQATRSAPDGSMPFPEVVRRLLDPGAEYYYVDCVALRTCFYSGKGDVVTAPILYEG